MTEYVVKVNPVLPSEKTITGTVNDRFTFVAEIADQAEQRTVEGTNLSRLVIRDMNRAICNFDGIWNIKPRAQNLIIMRKVVDAIKRQ